MTTLPLALLTLAIWFTLVLARGNFWQARETDEQLPRYERAGRPQRLRVTAIVPARNEADVIARSVKSLLAQDCDCDFDVIVVDDQSGDGTGGIALQAGGAVDGSDRLTVLRGEAPPPGWTGKLNAMRRGLAHVEDRAQAVHAPSGAPAFSSPDYLFFTDADIEHEPDVLSRLLGGAVAERRVLVSLMAQLGCDSRAERWLVPAFVYFFDMLYPFAWVNDPRRATAAAAGGCMLVERAALERVGGLESIRSALIDDCALGAALKKTGPIFLGLTHRVKSLRAYSRLADIRRMVVRSAYTELRHSPLRLAGAVLGMAATFLAPPLLAGSADAATGLVALAAFALMVLSYRPMLRRYRLSAWRGLFLPVVAALYVAFTIESAFAHWRGKGGAWKGRYQAADGGAS
ncbi:MAG: glycosyltransferase [Hyphomicrobiales bacterium]|nr:glycosyltransferase [Hyphomicrobiales bacterium]